MIEVLFFSRLQDDPWVSAAELDYITRGIATSPSSSSSIQAARGGETEALLGSDGNGDRKAAKACMRPAPMPVYGFMTSGALWAVIVGNFVSKYVLIFESGARSRRHKLPLSPLLLLQLALVEAPPEAHSVRMCLVTLQLGVLQPSDLHAAVHERRTRALAH